jgi:hypothetical protein
MQQTKQTKKQTMKQTTKTKNTKCTERKAKTARTTNRETSKFRKSDAPKAITLTVDRTPNGYMVREAVIVSRVNQHSSRIIPVNVRTVTNAINSLGLI